MAFPLRFTVPSREAEIAWERALAFVGRFSSMNLQVATDYLIETYKPDSAGEFGYAAARASGIAYSLFEVNCQAGGALGADKAQQNAHIFAYYVRTGVMPPDISLIARH